MQICANFPPLFEFPGYQLPLIDEQPESSQVGWCASFELKDYECSAAILSERSPQRRSFVESALFTTKSVRLLR